MIMKKEDLLISVEQYFATSLTKDEDRFIQGGGIEWDLSTFPIGFDWNFLQHLIGAGNRVDHLVYMFFYAQFIPDNSTVVEIGTLEGSTAIAIVMGARAVKKNIHVITIDPILLSEEEKINRKMELSTFEEYKAYYLNSNLFTFLRHIKESCNEGYITPVPGLSQEVLERWDGRPIEMLYVDGEHTYDAVKIDCEWMQYVKEGGIAVFDDWLECVEKAVLEYIEVHPEWVMVTLSTNQPRGNLWKTVFLKDSSREIEKIRCKKMP